MTASLEYWVIVRRRHTMDGYVLEFLEKRNQKRADTWSPVLHGGTRQYSEERVVKAHCTRLDDPMGDAVSWIKVTAINLKGNMR